MMLNNRYLLPTIAASILAALTSYTVIIQNATLDPVDSKYNIQLIQKVSRTVYLNKVLADLASAQAILESNLRGRPSNLAIQDNNLFGIKCTKDDMKCTARVTREVINGKTVIVNASFTHNDSLYQSFEQHKKLLSRPRYSKVLMCMTFECAAVEIVNAEYATDKSYTKKLIEIYKLYLQ